VFIFYVVRSGSVLHSSVCRLKMSQLLDKAKNFVSEKVNDMAKPEASVTDVDFKRVSKDNVEYLAKVSVRNPYSTSIPICEINYSFKSASRYPFSLLQLLNVDSCYFFQNKSTLFFEIFKYFIH